MKTASIRDLRYHFGDVERLLNEGETIAITKRKRVIARLLPVKPVVRQRPDFLARMRRIHGDKVLKVSNAQLLAAERSRS